ncbi:hypothetical protein HMPREF3230_00281 [Gardnerella vaginalis]|uniref:Transmembrane protein n=1 Tax=Gardnerella vaginalis TaxID=2702 RepID=A0A135ZA64_GARVA|nr:hypothetical protein HMPREF3230_00281 [Gardnerella vaginalis]
MFYCDCFQNVCCNFCCNCFVAIVAAFRWFYKFLEDEGERL